MNGTIEKLIEILKSNFGLEIFEWRADDPDIENFNFFVYSLNKLKRTTSCKWRQAINVRAVLSPTIPDGFEKRVVDLVESVGFILSNDDDIEYSKVAKGQTNEAVFVIDFVFHRSY